MGLHQIAQGDRHTSSPEKKNDREPPQQGEAASGRVYLRSIAHSIIDFKLVFAPRLLTPLLARLCGPSPVLIISRPRRSAHTAWTTPFSEGSARYSNKSPFPPHSAAVCCGSSLRCRFVCAMQPLQRVCVYPHHGGDDYIAPIFPFVADKYMALCFPREAVLREHNASSWGKRKVAFIIQSQEHPNLYPVQTHPLFPAWQKRRRGKMKDSTAVLSWCGFAARTVPDDNLRGLSCCKGKQAGRKKKGNRIS